MRERWFGATGLRVPQIAVEGDDVDLVDDTHAAIGGTTYEALIVGAAFDKDRLHEAHTAGVPVLVRARTAEEVKRALEQPEVACALVPPEARALRDLDLVAMTYG